MKKTINFFTTLILLQSAFSQDIIYITEGKRIDGKVIEITLDTIKYKPANNLDGPLRNIPIYGVYMIRYENGKEEFFKTEHKPVEKEEIFFSNNKDNYFSIATGLGKSYGGLGVRLQGRYGKKLGFGYHGGVGYYPSSEDAGGPALFYSFGLKFFWYNAWYFNIQYGPTVTYKSKYYKNGNVMYEDEGILYGPSFLIGGDWFFNKWIGINGALGVSANFSNENYNDAFAALDIGFIFKFQNEE